MGSQSPESDVAVEGDVVAYTCWATYYGFASEYDGHLELKWSPSGERASFARMTHNKVSDIRRKMRMTIPDGPATVSPVCYIDNETHADAARYFWKATPITVSCQ